MLSWLSLLTGHLHIPSPLDQVPRKKWLRWHLSSEGHVERCSSGCCNSRRRPGRRVQKWCTWRCDLVAQLHSWAHPARTATIGGRHEALHPWQRSWGRRLDICKGRIEPQESPWKSSSIYPHNQSLPTLLLCALTYTSDFTGGCPPPPLSEKELT